MRTNSLAGKLFLHFLCLFLIIPSLSLAPDTSSAAPVTKKVLPNGLTVLLSEVHSAPIVTSMIWYEAGSKDEDFGKTGIAHFLEHMMFKGTSKYGKGQIDLTTLKNGGINNAFTWTDYTAYFFEFSSDRWLDALEIEADRMNGCLFVSEEFESEKKVVIEERKIGEDTPEEALSEELDAIAFKAHGYHHPTLGWMSDLETVTRDDMISFYSRFYTPRNAVLVIVGDFDTKEALKKIEELFGGKETGPAVRRAATVEPRQVGERRVVLEMSANVPRVSVAHHAVEAGNRDNFPLILSQKLLAQGRSSRLYQKLVEELRVATSVDVQRYDFKDPCLFVVNCELKPDASPAFAESVIVSELVRLSDEEVGADELLKAKRLAESEFIMESESTWGEAVRLGAFETILSHTYLDTYLDNIYRVTPNDIKAAAAKYFVRKNRIVGWLMPEPETSSNPRGEESFREAFGSLERTNRPQSGFELYGHGAGLLRLPPSVCEKSAVSKHEVVPSAKDAAHPKSTSLFKAPKPTKKVLPNGLTLITYRKATTPSVSIGAYVKVGSRNDPEGKAGLASLAGRMLKEGTKKRTSFKIAEDIESVGGNISSDASVSFSSVSASLLSKDFDLGISLVSDLVRNPAFQDESVEKEKNKVLAEIRASDDNPRLVARRSFNEIVYGTHPLSHPVEGYKSTVSSITADDLRKFHRSYYLPQNTFLIVVGDVDGSLVEKKVREYFGTWEKEKFLPPSIPLAVRQQEKRTKFVKMEKEQINVYLGHLGITRDNPDYYALQAMDVILGFGGLFTSRIISNLRDTQGLAYSVYSDITRSSGIDPGVFVAYIGTSPGNKDKALDGFLGEIRRIRDEPVKEEELENAKKYLTGNYVFDFETNDQLATYFFKSSFYGLGDDYISRYPGLIRSVTVGDVQRVARKYLDPDNYSLAVVGRVDESGNIIIEEK
ncbi:MAG: pitrilysin family protein [Candidatus Eisenbacteria bacterium]|nr:pitrilysin family protein [Candidatus Eisenbacteria bacterium]